MIKILIVEDEPPIIRILKSLIEGYGENCIVTATAFNGKKALEILKMEQIDLVFSDIKMPVADGIELAKEMSQQYSHIPLVLVSGYQEFNYAKLALGYGVYEYLLKPINKEELYRTLDKICQELRMQEYEKIRLSLRKSLRSNKTEEDKVLVSSSSYELILVCAGTFSMSIWDEMSSANEFWDQCDLEQLAKTMLLEEENVMCFHGKSVSEMIAVIELKEENSNIRRCELIQGIYNKLIQVQGLPITIAATDQLIKLSEVRMKAKQLRGQLYKGIKLYRSAILDSSVMQVNLSLTESMNELLRSIVIEVHNKNNNRLKESLNKGLTELWNKEVSQLQVVELFDKVIEQCKDMIVENNYHIINLKREMEEALSYSEDLPSFTEDIANILGSIMFKEDCKIKDTRVPKIVTEIVQYLNENYNRRINNTLLSKEFGLVPSYLSKVFRTYKEVSPVEYLTSLRIRNSKILMKEQPDLLLKEISELVGFSDQNYFSKIFKKETGVWPSEYREAL